MLDYSGIIKYSGNKFNRFPFFNESVWQAAVSQTRSTFFQNTILLNEKKAVCECVSANIFFIKKNELLTPGLLSGCFEDTLRAVILEITKNMGLKTTESADIKREDIFHIDELFIASEETGIQWILGVENKRFVHEYSVSIHEKLNEYLKEKEN